MKASSSGIATESYRRIRAVSDVKRIRVLESDISVTPYDKNFGSFTKKRKLFLGLPYSGRGAMDLTSSGVVTALTADIFRSLIKRS